MTCFVQLPNLTSVSTMC